MDTMINNLDFIALFQFPATSKLDLGSALLSLQIQPQLNGQGRNLPKFD